MAPPELVGRWDGSSCVSMEVSVANTSTSDCCPGGTIQRNDMQKSWGLMAGWLLILCWVFLGVSIGADLFMAAIEVITSKEAVKKVTDRHGVVRLVHVRVWNETVANLTLMALGSSAPEILLNVMEILLNDFHAGALGPSTIVGSAAFNLMVISAACMVKLPPGESRTIKKRNVFLCTAASSVFAYLWLLVIVKYSSKDIIEPWEAAVTIVFMVILIVVAYLIDKRADTNNPGAINVLKCSSEDLVAAFDAGLISTDVTGLSHDEARAALQWEKPLTRTHHRIATRKALFGSDFNPLHRRFVSKGSPLQAAAPAGGVIGFALHKVSVVESMQSVTLCVVRKNGASGAVSVRYTTRSGRAIANRDFEEARGELAFADGDVGPREITINILDDSDEEKDEQFLVMLYDITGDAVFDRDEDGGENSDICTVTIVNDDEAPASGWNRTVHGLGLDSDELAQTGDTWEAQFASVWKTPAGTTRIGLVFFCLSSPWRLLFALVPPPTLCGGWPCFVGALLLIGFQVILVSDFGSQMGCHMGLHPSVTAITFVALGTSLPDLFASMQAANAEKTADNAIGNVTGSNSVNVYFGLGLPWLIASIYWEVQGASSEWKATYKDLHQSGIKGGFVVRSGDLTFSVIVFTLCALITITAILLRRPHELGGSRRSKYATGLMLFTLWAIYVILSSLVAEEIFSVSI